MKWFRVSAVMLLTAVLLLAACRPSSGTGKLVYGLTLAPSSIDPHVGASSELGIPLTSVYDPLVWLSPKGEYVPGLAERWVVSAEGTVYTFDLRQDKLDPEERTNLQRVYKACQEFAETPDGWLVLTGEYGCGKTHLAAAIANDLVARGQPALFIVVPELLDHLRATFSPTSHVRFDKRFEEVRTAPLLVLDDLGTENASPWAREKLFQLFNYRYNVRLPTVVTLHTANPHSGALDEVEPRWQIRDRSDKFLQQTFFGFVGSRFDVNRSDVMRQPRQQTSFDQR